jgi:hypothetical protein
MDEAVSGCRLREIGILELFQKLFTTSGGAQRY